MALARAAVLRPRRASPPPASRSAPGAASTTIAPSRPRPRRRPSSASTTRSRRPSSSTPAPTTSRSSKSLESYGNWLAAHHPDPALASGHHRRRVPKLSRALRTRSWRVCRDNHTATASRHSEVRRTYTDPQRNGRRRSRRESSRTSSRTSRSTRTAQSQARFASPEPTTYLDARGLGPRPLVLRCRTIRSNRRTCTCEALARSRRRSVLVYTAQREPRTSGTKGVRNGDPEGT